MKIFRLSIEILGYLFKGEFSYAINIVAKRCPAWLFRYNKAWIMRTESYKLPQNINAEIKIKIADDTNINDIVRISQVTPDYATSLLKSGAVCMMAARGNDPFNSLTWFTTGHCYVRGMGWQYDFSDDTSYVFGASTLLEARKQGLHSALMAEYAKYELSRGISKFYGLLEFTNDLSIGLRRRYGYEIVFRIFYIKFLFMKLCIAKNFVTNQSSIRLILKEPSQNITII